MKKIDFLSLSSGSWLKLGPKLGPQIEKNDAKIDSKSMLKNYTFSNMIFYRFLSVLDPPKRAKIDNFFNLFEKVDFVKIIVLPWEN